MATVGEGVYEELTFNGVQLHCVQRRARWQRSAGNQSLHCQFYMQISSMTGFGIFDEDSSTGMTAMKIQELECRHRSNDCRASPRAQMTTSKPFAGTKSRLGTLPLLLPRDRASGTHSAPLPVDLL